MVKFFAVGTFAILLVAASPALADQATHQHGQKACCDMPCCQAQPKAEPAKAEQPKAEPTAVDYVLAAGFMPAGPVRQELTVWFKRPVLVGRSILHGHYVIEHDNERMARGEPCTHIYAYNDRTTPVVVFHCTHLEREKATSHQVVLQTGIEFQKLQEFQFAGETAAHGVPATIR
jgi:hypothetical protein